MMIPHSMIDLITSLFNSWKLLFNSLVRYLIRLNCEQEIMITASRVRNKYFIGGHHISLIHYGGLLSSFYYACAVMGYIVSCIALHHIQCIVNIISVAIDSCAVYSGLCCVSPLFFLCVLVLCFILATCARFIFDVFVLWIVC